MDPFSCKMGPHTCFTQWTRAHTPFRWALIPSRWALTPTSHSKHWPSRLLSTLKMGPRPSRALAPYDGNCSLFWALTSISCSENEPSLLLNDILVFFIFFYIKKETFSSKNALCFWLEGGAGAPSAPPLGTPLITTHNQENFADIVGWNKFRSDSKVYGLINQIKQY